MLVVERVLVPGLNDWERRLCVWLPDMFYINRRGPGTLFPIWSDTLWTSVVLCLLPKKKDRATPEETDDRPFSYSHGCACAHLFNFLRHCSRASGVDMSVTICYAVGVTLFYSAIHVFAFSFLHLAYIRLGCFDKTFANNGRQTVRRLAVVLGVSAASSALLLFIPAVTMPYSSGPKMLYILSATHFVGMSVIITVNGMIVLPQFSRKIIAELQSVLKSLDSSASSPSESLLFVLNRMISFHRSIKVISIFAAPSAAILG
jgi:hypothetical protein